MIAVRNFELHMLPVLAYTLSGWSGGGTPSGTFIIGWRVSTLTTPRGKFMKLLPKMTTSTHCVWSIWLFLFRINLTAEEGQRQEGTHEDEEQLHFQWRVDESLGYLLGNLRREGV